MRASRRHRAGALAGPRRGAAGQLGEQTAAAAARAALLAKVPDFSVARFPHKPARSSFEGGSRNIGATGLQKGGPAVNDFSISVRTILPRNTPVGAAIPRAIRDRWIC